jgi:hypothetical protein
MLKRLALIAAFVLVSAGNGSTVLAQQGRGNSNNEKVTICHKTGSETNPWVKVTVSQNALKAHLAHGDFVVDVNNPCPPVEKEGEQKRKVVLCHRTGSETNPWVVISVDENAVDAHLQHGDFVVTEDATCPPKGNGGNGGGQPETPENPENPENPQNPGQTLGTTTQKAQTVAPAGGVKAGGAGSIIAPLLGLGSSLAATVYGALRLRKSE